MKTKTMLSRLSLAAAACLIGGAAMAYPAQVSQDLNMRTGPGTNYQVLGVLPGGAIVDVEGCRGSWCRVEYRGRQGWTSARFLGEVRQSRVHRAPAPVYRAPPPAYGYYDRVRPSPGVVIQFGFGSDHRYDDRPRHRRDVRRDRHHRGDFHPRRPRHWD